LSTPASLLAFLITGVFCITEVNLFLWGRSLPGRLKRQHVLGCAVGNIFLSPDRPSRIGGLDTSRATALPVLFCSTLQEILLFLSNPPQWLNPNPQAVELTWINCCQWVGVWRTSLIPKICSALSIDFNKLLWIDQCPCGARFW